MSNKIEKMSAPDDQCSTGSVKDTNKTFLPLFWRQQPRRIELGFLGDKES